MEYAGEDNLLIGTDYGHTDQSSEIEALRIFQEQGSVDPDIVSKILDANPRAVLRLLGGTSRRSCGGRNLAPCPV